jgi:hypothetical protein
MAFKYVLCEIYTSVDEYKVANELCTIYESYHGFSHGQPNGPSDRRTVEGGAAPGIIGHTMVESYEWEVIAFL